ncbi:MAG: YbhB/YbcL family Raf kinase inhibitor-like protein [Planctomycetota bacterium]|jgi:Raf kinase inhibitor-like YbhB/YbcL family protein
MITFVKTGPLLVLAAALALGPGCEGKGGDGDEQGEGRTMTMTLTSSAFADGQAIPAVYTGDGKDISPPLSWSNLPDGTKELALIVDDPDAPAGTWDHWIVYKIPADRDGLAEGAGGKGRKAAAPMVEGKNSWGNVGYGGPAPPPGHGLHHYHFELYALDAALDLPAGSAKARLEAAMKGHVLGRGELVGTYRR